MPLDSPGGNTDHEKTPVLVGILETWVQVLLWMLTSGVTLVKSHSLSEPLTCLTHKMEGGGSIYLRKYVIVLSLMPVMFYKQQLHLCKS